MEFSVSKGPAANEPVPNVAGDADNLDRDDMDLSAEDGIERMAAEGGVATEIPHGKTASSATTLADDAGASPRL